MTDNSSFNYDDTSCYSYHHAFPSDYATGEFGSFSVLTYFIEAMEWIGQAYDLKKTSNRVIELTKENARRMNLLNGNDSCVNGASSFSLPSCKDIPVSQTISSNSDSLSSPISTKTVTTSFNHHHHNNNFRMTESLG